MTKNFDTPDDGRVPVGTTETDTAQMRPEIEDQLEDKLTVKILIEKLIKRKDIDKRNLLIFALDAKLDDAMIQEILEAFLIGDNTDKEELKSNIQARYGKAIWTQDELAKLFGVTRRRIIQIRDEIQNDIKRILNVDN